MKTYVVTERHNISLGPGTVFMANPEDVSGALKTGAIVEVQEGAAGAATASQSQAQPAQGQQKTQP
ncbi:hypothetical protein GCM10025857_06770 [Alicyclobacillus contaminans]|uniref:hypothetical protein n=1 Tax=Alicyclobacillus contaminans TaxID=392016 RepID=UPI00040C9B03|nr:hypothetical protein [Alicyclobacillus contaminans]GMA49320.1 hypothetical protein GCM10025857_06770 [Alicyclobacillus contaminans]